MDSKGNTLLSVSHGREGEVKVKRDTQGDIVADTLEHYRQRIKDNDTRTPEGFQKIQKRLQKIADEGKKVLVDIKDSYSNQTVVIRFEYIHDRWAMGYSISYLDGKEVRVPYTIHYSDIYCRNTGIKMVTEGEHPYG